MQLSHTFPVVSARFDDPNLVSCAGALVDESGLAASRRADRLSDGAARRLALAPTTSRC